jgi:hypothetical protein
MGSLLQVCLAAQGEASYTPRGTAHMKKTLLAFLIVGLLASTGYARGGHGGRRHAGGTVSVRGDVRHDGTYVAPQDSTGSHGKARDNWSTKGNVHPSTGQPGTKDPDGDMGGDSGGYGPISANLPLFPRALRLLHAAFCCLSGCAPARCSSQVRTADS